MTAKGPDYAYKYCSQNPTPLTLRQLLFYERHCNTERLLKSANYIRTELPIRIAHRIREFQKLPYILGTNPYIESVYSLYWEAFERIRKISEIKTREENDRFCKMLEESLDAHLVVIPRLAKGINECEQHGIISMDKLDIFMNATLRSRISRRVLAEHHLVLSKRRKSIFNLCSSHDILTKCTRLVQAAYPNVINVKINVSGRDTEFTYVSDHIEYIIYQLLSNAYRHSIDSSAKEIKVTLCSNENNVLFRISDQGEGIKKEIYENLWTYGNYNMEKIERLEAKLNENINMRLGIGLPMSRVYAEYWGGEIKIITMEGFGTDAYVRIPRLGTQNENITSESLDEAIMS
ncbi:branched-chain alpha-ketoacid dehydrogenase [Cokeromyces recurvatus]|uniref:branched-chain alpha-ketoacid dehydrogenase n=1 Tax=Cokeromyces recurvatus TaxID=90255 RepID=UPI002220C09D|nr:branched-chain alpha-ketoacid dehydrogenase [Cokeromyces recurvatus]KAI7902516.1 branched-chain alpha-ketoacid dehydrogenase [Cokeromyces recurvatus]